MATSYAASSQSAFPTIAQVVEKYSDKSKYSITAQFFGYRAKEDITALPNGYLVSPSQNVLTNAAGLIFSRPGYSLYGQAASNQSVVDGIRSSYDWETHLGFEHHLREHGGVLEWVYTNPTTGAVSWLTLMDQNTMSVWTQGNNFFRYAEYWNTTELTDELLYVNGDGNVYRWNGALAYFASATSSALSANPFLSNNPPGEVISFACPPGATFSGSTTTAGNAVLSSTINGQVYGFIIIANQPNAGDTINLTINSTPVVLTFVSSPNQPPWKGGNSGGSIALGYNYTNVGSTVHNIWLQDTSSPSVTQTRQNFLSFLSDPAWQNTAFYVGFGQNTVWTSLIQSIAWNSSPLISGSTTTSGNVVGTNGSNLTFAMVNNPANGDNATIVYNGQSVRSQFVNAVANPGDVKIGLNAAATLTNWLGLLQNPGTSNSTQEAYSTQNQLIVAEFNYVVSTGITIQGQQTWSELGFYDATGGRSVVINGALFNYTGGEGTQTITGVSPDPTTSIAIIYGDPIVQAPMVCPGSAITSLPSNFNPNLILTLANQVFYGSTARRDIYFSKTNNFADVSANAPRQPADGSGSTGITLDATCTGFAAQDTSMNVFAGPDWIYNVYFGPGTPTQPNTQSSDVVSGTTLIYEGISTTALKISPGQGAISQESVFKVKNSVMFLTNEPAIDDLGRVVDNLALPEAITITDSIKNDFLNYDLVGAWGLYFKYFLYIVIPAEQKIIVYNFSHGWWEAPQTFNFSRLSIIGGALYAHSNAVPETYRLFIDNPLDPNVVYSDNGNPIEAIAYFSYQNFGMRGERKHFTELYVEGYLSSNTTITCGSKYDFGGFSGEQTYSVLGNNSTFLVYTFADNSIGKVPIGKNPVGSITDSVQNTPKFRHIFTSANIDFSEWQFFAQSNDVNQQWSFLAFGPDVSISENQLGDLKS